MPRISDVMKDLNLDQATFSKIYEKVMGKKMTAKTVTVSDANLEKIAYIADELGKKKTQKPAAPKKVQDSKFLKSEEI